MLALPATITRNAIPPGFIDFASSSFDAILFPPTNAANNDVIETATDTTTTTSTDDSASTKKRNTHLPDLIPFIQLITDKCDLQPIHLVIALMYVQRFRRALPAGYKAEVEAAHRIFVASLLVAHKYLEDRPLSARKLVRATGDVWPISDITRMELAFLRFLNWNLYVSHDDMAKFLHDLGFDERAVINNSSA
ncbi:hypothetical protein BDF20DRAFT_882128 [Mycotypha africana]|uniref:uncharacterized protein n=1 Tax=Mycotypha africana TaxID=64632 RepID=UPI002301C236|nr:uncharacterized protein BDF20DRAFT_882128 [Mycotypha africana]KAI8973391.1 hypothetical protein BDF20DRAFT_882128 [Mycotypha africana]